MNGIKFIFTNKENFICFIFISLNKIISFIVVIYYIKYVVISNKIHKSITSYKINANTIK